MFHKLPRRFALLACLCGTALAAQTSGVWLDVPFVKQEDEGCGAASIAMVIEYWQTQQPQLNIAVADPEAIQSALYSPSAHGIYASAMERYLREHGFMTFAFHGGWDDLRQHLGKGRPLIVALRPKSTRAALHYVVVVGLDWGQNVVQVNDGAQRKLLKVDRERFEKEWTGAGHWTLLALPPATPDHH